MNIRMSKPDLGFPVIALTGGIMLCLLFVL